MKELAARVGDKIKYLNREELKQVELELNGKLKDKPKIFTKDLVHSTFFDNVNDEFYEPINSVEYAEKLVVGLGNGDIRLFDVTSKECVRVLSGHTKPVLMLQHVGTTLFSASGDHTVREWDMETGLCKHVFAGHTGPVTTVSCSENRIVSGSNDQTIRVWDTREKKCLKTLQGHEHWVRCLQADGSRIVSGSYDETIKVWDLPSGKLLGDLAGSPSPLGYVWSVQFSGEVCVSGSTNGAQVWDLGTLHYVRSLPHPSTVKSLQFENNLLATACTDRKLYFWNVDTADLLKTISLRSTPYFLTFGKDRLVVGCDEGSIELWS